MSYQALRNRGGVIPDACPRLDRGSVIRNPGVGSYLDSRQASNRVAQADKVMGMTYF